MLKPTHRLTGKPKKREEYSDAERWDMYSQMENDVEFQLQRKLKIQPDFAEEMLFMVKGSPKEASVRQEVLAAGNAKIVDGKVVSNKAQ